MAENECDEEKSDICETELRGENEFDGETVEERSAKESSGFLDEETNIKPSKKTKVKKRRKR